MPYLKFTVLALFFSFVLSACGQSIGLRHLPDSAQQGQYSDSYTYQLDNGLTVLLWPNKNSVSNNEANLSLIIHAGSLQETQEQLGYAHFVEHMVFNQESVDGSNPVQGILDGLNINMGMHWNATTHSDYTRYFLDLPNATDKRVAAGLELLSIFGIHAQFGEAEVQKEIGVIREEWRQSQPDKDSFADQRLAKDIANSRYQFRLPIGTVESIENVTVDELQAYYQAHYRPNNATLIVTGDFDLPNAVKAIEHRFSLWQQQQPGRAPTYPLPPLREGTFDIYTDTNVREYQILLGNAYHFSHMDQPESIYWHVITELALQMLNERMQTLTKQQHQEIRELQAYMNRTFVNYGNVVVRLISSEAKLQEGFKLLASIVKDISTRGFTQNELDNATRLFLASEANQQDNASYLSSLAFQHVTYGAWLRDQQHYYELMSSKLPKLSLSALNDHVKTLFKQPYKLSIISSPGRSAPDEASVREWINQADTEIQYPSTSLPVTSQVAWQIDLPPGAVTQQKELKHGIHQLTLSNGIHVNYKYSESDSDRVFMSLQAPGGLNGLNDQQIVNALLANQIMRDSGLQTLDGEALRAWLKHQNITIEPTITPISRGFYLEGDSAKIGQLLQTLHVAVQDARVDIDTYNDLIPRIKQTLRDMNATTTAAFYKKIDAIQSQGEFAYRRITVDDINKASPEGIQAIYEQIITGAQDYTVNIVGDIPLEELIPHLENYVASLPSQPSTLRPQPSKKMVGDFEVIEQGNTSKAAKIIYFLQTNNDLTDALIKEQWQVLASLLSKALHNTLREKLGLTYDVNVRSVQQFPGDEVVNIVIALEVDPDNVVKVKERINTVLADVHSKGFEQTDIDAELATLRQDYARFIQFAPFILDQLVDASLQGKPLENRLTAEGAYPDITADQINRLMDQLLNKQHGKLMGILYP